MFSCFQGREFDGGISFWGQINRVEGFEGHFGAVCTGKDVCGDCVWNFDGFIFFLFDES